MKPYYYVYCPSQGQPTVKHDTLEIAQGEAERLAAKHPGSAFEILRCVGIAQCSTASTFWVDGEGPPEKPRYRDLEEGEIIRSGDEFTRDAGSTWHASGLDGHQYVPSDPKGQSCLYHFPHRRPL